MTIGGWIKAVASLHVDCQKNKILGCGPQQVIGFGRRGLYKDRVMLMCGHSISLSWLPTWEQEACKILRKRVTSLITGGDKYNDT